MIALFNSYGDLIIRGMPGEKLGQKYNSRKSHARRQTGAIIARGSANSNISKSNPQNNNKSRDYRRLKADD